MEEVWEPAPAEAERLRLQRDGCAGDIAFLAYSTVRSAAVILVRLLGSIRTCHVRQGLDITGARGVAPACLNEGIALACTPSCR